MPIRHNVSLRVIDSRTGKVVQTHTGHNSATNTLVTGIAHYLTGDGVLNQGYHMLSQYVPRYISLGTMGLYSQDSNAEGLPVGIGVAPGDEIQGYRDYMTQTPDFGADGYDINLNNGRRYLGLGPMYEDREGFEVPDTGLVGDVNLDGKVDIDDLLTLVDNNCGAITLTGKALKAADINKDGIVNCDDVQLLKEYVMNPDPKKESLGTYEYTSGTIPAVNCELISKNFPRVKISYRDIVPEYEAEFPRTVDVVFSAMISTAALTQFREPDNNYIFISEVGLWSTPEWVAGSDNGLLAGYRLAPSDQRYWGMDEESVTDDVAILYLHEHGNPNPSEEEISAIKPTIAADNRNRLQKSILRVGPNQVVQVIWKIQIGGLEQLQNINSIYEESNKWYWYFWDEE